jgi:hypothetical protein
MCNASFRADGHDVARIGFDNDETPTADQTHRPPLTD